MDTTKATAPLQFRSGQHRLGKLIDATLAAKVSIITRYGRPAAALLPIDEYYRLRDLSEAAERTKMPGMEQGEADAR